MKKKSAIVISALLVSLLVVRCIKDNNNQTNSITYNNNTYGIDKGVLENYGNIRGNGINIDLTLLSSGLIIVESNGLIDSITGTGNGANFEMFTSGSTALDVRDYTFDKDSTGAPGTFDFGNIILNFNTTTEQGINLNITGGTISVKSAGPQYEITFNCTVEGGKGVTGYYKGPLKYYDNTIVRSARIKSAKWWK